MIDKVIKDRRSTVLFDKQNVDNKLLLSLFEAARWAPSSNNVQPWRFIYARRGDEFHDVLLDCLNPGNKVWASQAPVLILTVAQIISNYKNRTNMYAWHDTAMSYSNLVYQATSMGLFLHPMGGYDRTKATSVSRIPEGYEPVIFAALGYRSEPHSGFSADLLNREAEQRVRKDINEIVFHGNFGSSNDLKR